MELPEVANKLISLDQNIVLVYAFNATGKTRLSVSYKDVTKEANDDKHSGVYYNAFSEDLFIWDNDEGNDGQDICLNVLYSSLSQFHSMLNEEDIHKKLKPYNPRFNFRFDMNADTEKGIEKISFFMEEDKDTNIKISRGEERIFVWCFFLALFEIDEWADVQSSHFFIDDPVSSLDDHNIFVTATTLLDLIENNFNERKIILTTHHIGLFSILYNWLKKGEKASLFRKSKTESHVKAYILKRNENDDLLLDKFEKNVFLYHLHLLQKLKKAQDEDELYSFHFVLLRQVLESVSSFLGVGNFRYTLEQIGIDDADNIGNMINVLSHKNIFYYESDMMVPDNKLIFNEILDGLFKKYEFQI